MIELFKFAALLITIIGGVFAISSQIRKQREKYATKDYVDNKMETAEKEYNLKIEAIRQFQEEHVSLLEHIVERVDKIYDKHYKA